VTAMNDSTTRIPKPAPLRPNHDDSDEAPVEWIGNTSLSYRVIKRIFDVVVSIIALILMAPIFLIISIAVRLTSRGPVFYPQRRLGYHRRPFLMYKFRTMANVEPRASNEYLGRLLGGEYGEMGLSSSSKMKHDPRITSVGRFLRRTSLDELPQFFNVLKGDMTIVGPRPPIAYEWQAYEKWHKLRLSSTPGITGLWQISARTPMPFDDMVKLDLEYIQKQSVWLDLKILLMTPVAVFRQNF